MMDAILKIAYRVAPEPFAQRISETIWQRECDRRWKARVAAHTANGGVRHVIIDENGSVKEWLA